MRDETRIERPMQEQAQHLPLSLDGAPRRAASGTAGLLDASVGLMTPSPDPLPSREPEILHGLLHDRISRLWSYRKFRCAYPSLLPLLWPAYTAELHCLVRLARAARRQAEADTVWRLGLARQVCMHGVRETEECPECGFAWVPEQADPVTAAKGYHDWQSR